MKELSFRTKLYLCCIYMGGLAVMAWRIRECECQNPGMLIILSVLASLGLIFKVEGATHRSHYTFSFIVYAFTFASYGTSAAILVIAVSNLIEWIWSRPPWFFQLFNCTCDILLMQVAGLVYQAIDGGHSVTSGQAVVALVASMAAFDLLNHLAVGVALWLARQETFAQSGVFDFFPLMLDLALLYFGATLVFVWNSNGAALLLALIPIYVIYRTLRIPSLERQTRLDCKTGLFNDSYFKRQFEDELKRANRFDRPLAIIMADLDLLRNINNTYGHLAGDDVLIGVARVLKDSMREYDIVSRFGGEEFAILLPETSLQDAYVQAESIRKAIEETDFAIRTGAGSVRATMSFGVACREQCSQTAEEIFHHADAALYQSKFSGRNRVYTYSLEACLKCIPDPEAKSLRAPSIAHI